MTLRFPSGPKLMKEYCRLFPLEIYIMVFYLFSPEPVMLAANIFKERSIPQSTIFQRLFTKAGVTQAAHLPRV